MELMIKHSEIVTILIQAFMITAAGFIFVGCWDEVLYDIKRNFRRSRKLRMKGGKYMRQFTCPVCGYEAWALDHILEATCKCGNLVKTEPVPKVKDEESFMFDKKRQKRQIV